MSTTEENKGHSISYNWGSQHSMSENQIVVANKILTMLRGLSHQESKTILSVLMEQLPNVAIIQ